MYGLSKFSERVKWLIGVIEFICVVFTEDWWKEEHCRVHLYGSGHSEAVSIDGMY